MSAGGAKSLSAAPSTSSRKAPGTVRVTGTPAEIVDREIEAPQARRHAAGERPVRRDERRGLIRFFDGGAEDERDRFRLVLGGRRLDEAQPAMPASARHQRRSGARQIVAPSCSAPRR